MVLSSDQIAALLAGAKSTAEVDAIVWTLTKDGHVPDAIAKSFWKWVVIEEGGHRLEALFAPCYYALGSDDDPWFVDRTSEALAQNVADRFGAMLPTWKLLKAAQAQSDPKIPYVDVKAHGIPIGKIETHEASVVANELARAAYDKLGIGIGDHLVLTWAKAFIVHRSKEDGSHLCIAGGSYDSTTGQAFVQTPCSPHVVSYGDVSQRIVLASLKCRLDGEDADLRNDVALSKDPAIWRLVNDTGVRFDPTFPNVSAGGGSVSKDSVAVVVDEAGKPLGGRPDGAVGAGASSTTAPLRGAVLGAGAGALGGLVLSLSPLGIAALAGGGALLGRYLGKRAA